MPAITLARQRELVSAFLAASREGDFDRLLSLLDPQVVFRPDLAARLGGPRQEIRGAEEVAKLFWGRAQAARMATVMPSCQRCVASSRLSASSTCASAL